MKKLFAVGFLLWSIVPCWATLSKRALWKMPRGADFEALQRRPGGKIALFWSRATRVGGHHTYLMQRTLLDEKSGRELGKHLLPGVFVAPNIETETFNTRGQHAFLPQCYGQTTTFLRLKEGAKYRTLQNLPRFDRFSLQDLKFSPDGEVLKVLGRERLWIIGAQSGRLLRVIKPNRGKWWSRENAVLSPDGFTVLAMREKMTLFSARTGRLMKQFGVHLETYGGHCGDFEARVLFSPDGHSAIALQQDGSDAFEFAATGGKRLWTGQLPVYNLRYSRDGRFYFAFRRSADERTEYPVVKSARSHRTVAFFPTLRFNDTFSMPVEFSSDSQAILWVQNGVLWRAPLKAPGF